MVEAGSPLAQSRVTGAFWLLCVAGGFYGYFAAKGTHAGQDAILIAGCAYLVVTVLLYALLRPVNPVVALLQGALGIVGIATSGDGSFYFGVQCILIGYLVIVSTFLPRTIGVLMVLAGIAQLLFFSTLLPAAFTHKFASIGYVTDGVGEIAMALWLLFIGVNPSRWHAAAARTSVAA